jgi:hypothetical protein
MESKIRPHVSAKNVGRETEPMLNPRPGCPTRTMSQRACTYGDAYHTSPATRNAGASVQRAVVVRQSQTINRPRSVVQNVQARYWPFMTSDILCSSET